MSAAPPLGPLQRRRVLGALGVVAYRLRGTPPAGRRHAEPNPADAARQPVAGGSPRLVVVAGDRAAAAPLLAALGIAASDTLSLDVRDGRLSATPPVAPAYLVIGEEWARVLGAELPTPVQQAARIVVVPARWRGDALAKRLVWQNLRPLCRALRVPRP